MIPGRYDIIIYRDTTYSLPGISKKDANDVYIDFQADYIDTPGDGDGKIELVIRPPWKNRASETKLDPLYTLSDTIGTIIVATTVLSLLVPASVTSAFTFNEGFYELELYTGDTEPVVDQLLHGKVTVLDRKPL